MKYYLFTLVTLVALGMVTTGSVLAGTGSVNEIDLADFDLCAIDPSLFDECAPQPPPPPPPPPLPPVVVTYLPLFFDLWGVPLVNWLEGGEGAASNGATERASLTNQNGPSPTYADIPN